MTALERMRKLNTEIMTEYKIVNKITDTLQGTQKLIKEYKELSGKNSFTHLNDVIMYHAKRNVRLRVA